MRFPSSTWKDLTLDSSWNYKGGQIIKWTSCPLADSGKYWEIKSNIFSFGYRDGYVSSSEAAGIETAWGRKICNRKKQLNLSECIYRRDIFFIKWGQQLLVDIRQLDFLTKYKEITMQKACGMPSTKYKW